MSIDHSAPPNISGPAAGGRFAALSCLLLVGSLLGLSLVNAKLAVNLGADPLVLLCLATIVSGAILMAREWRSGHIATINRPLAVYALVTGALFAAPNVAGFLAVRHVGAGFLSLTVAFPILLTYALSLSLRLERFNRLKALGVCAGLTGGCILALSKISGGSSPAFWVVVAMATPMAIAIGNIYRTLRWPPGVSSMFLASAMLLCGGLIVLPMALISAPAGFIDIVTHPNLALVLVSQTAIFAVLYFFYFVLQRLAGPVYLSQIGSIGAIVGTATAVVFLHEALPTNIVAAALFVVGGIVLFQIGGKRIKPGSA